MISIQKLLIFTFGLLNLSIVHSQTEGVAIMSDQAPSYKGSTFYNAEVRDFTFINDSTVEIKQRPLKTSYQGKGFELAFSSSIGIENKTSLPEIQNVYAQGQSSGGILQWFGPETGEVFSWGPALRTLEYSTTPYNYDKNGSLVPAGSPSGSGIPAKAYRNEDFFRTGFSTTNNVCLRLPFVGRSAYIEANLGQNLKNSPIRNADFESYNTNLAFKRIIFGEFEAEALGSYNFSEGKLLPAGSNMASLMASLFTTPPSFDNKNGLSSKKAASGDAAWRLPSGSMRSYAPGVTDNPYAFLNALPDKEKSEHILASARLQYKEASRRGLSALLRGDFQQFTNKKYNGLPEGFAVTGNEFRFCDYRLKSNTGELQFVPSFLSWNDDHEFKFYTDYSLNLQQNDVNLEINMPPSTSEEIKNTSRTSQELKYGVEWKFNFDHDTNELLVRIANRHYFSNTASDFNNFFPYAGVKVDLTGFLRDLWYDIDHLSISFNAGKSAHEAPLVYNDLSVLSTDMNVSDFNRYFEYQFITAGHSLKPEIKKEYNAGLSLKLYPNKLSYGVDYFHITTDNFIAPVQQSGKYNLDNVAKVNNSGWNMSLSYHNNFYYNEWSFKVNLNWSTFKNEVKETKNGSYIPLAGFNEISTGMLPGKPLGAIYGTSWLRDEQGKQIIGDDGFPLVNNEISMIGNPTPDWTAGINPVLGWKRLWFDFMITIRQGGDVWNGTAAALDYLGMSQNTAQQRNIKSYIFDGVNSNGQINTIPVDFYDPSQDIGKNRWVRYGFSGVGEEYICDASWVRLSNAGLQYDFKIRSSTIKKFSVSIRGYNLLAFTKYKGTDPSSTLFNYASGNGLDLFNLPASRSWLLTLKMNLGK